MNQQKSIDKIIEAVEARIQDVLGGLLGADFTLIGGDKTVVTKEVAFKSRQGKHICALMDITGEITGKGCLLLGIKDAIRLGGTLIMLPAGELEEMIGQEEYSEEIEDSYGEIANIIAGSFTKDFEEMYPKSCRFVRNKHEVLHPSKVDIESDSPIENQAYYQVAASMVLDGRQMGDMVMLMPADIFGLQEKEKPEASSVSSTEPEAAGKEKFSSTAGDSQGQSEETAEQAHALDPPAQMPVGPKFNAEKHKKKVNSLLLECQKKVETDVSALLGADITLCAPENKLLGKKEFFAEHVAGCQVLADLEVAGEVQGKSYLAVSMRDAIHLGGILTMLPPAELENVIKEEDFSEEIRDAYGEIANIIAGVYTAVFEAQYTKRIRFVKTELQQVVPMKVDIAADKPIPDQDYYLSRMDLTLGDAALGKVNLLFPADLLQLSGLRPGSVADEEKEQTAASGQRALDEEKTGSRSVQKVAKNEQRSLDILVVGDDEPEVEKIAAVLDNAGYFVKTLSFKDNLHNYIPGNLRAIYLVMRDVNEQAFGVAIKVSSACSVPLIAAGPGWTRTKVIKAVKYGVRDILMTPAAEGDITENVNNNLLELAV